MTVDPGPARGPKKSRVLAGPRTYQLLYEDDGWSSIQDGQNAACGRALFDLLPDQQLQHVLPYPYRELWLKWQATLQGASERQRSELQQAKSDFVQSLLDSKRQQSTQQPGEPSGWFLCRLVCHDHCPLQYNHPALHETCGLHFWMRYLGKICILCSSC